VSFISYELDGDQRFGAIVEERVVDLTDELPEYADLTAVLAAGALNRARDVAINTSSRFEADRIHYLPPLPPPGRLFCATLDPQSDRAGPLRLRSRYVLVGHRNALAPPPGGQLRVGSALALAVGTGGRSLEGDALDERLAGASLMINGELRDWPEADREDVFARHNADATAALGPGITALAELDPDGELELAMDGEAVQHLPLRRLLGEARRLLTQLSRVTRLQPGDLLAVIAPRDASVPLAPGSSLALSAEGLGELRTRLPAD